MRADLCRPRVASSLWAAGRRLGGSPTGLSPCSSGVVNSVEVRANQSASDFGGSWRVRRGERRRTQERRAREEDEGGGGIFWRRSCGSRRKRLGSIAARLGTAKDQRTLLNSLRSDTGDILAGDGGKVLTGPSDVSSSEKPSRATPASSGKRSRRRDTS